MFTGIVEETGRVESIGPAPEGIALAVSANICAQDVKPGDSIAINGCCLTVEQARPHGGGKILDFTLLQESWRRTNLQFAPPGSAVNLERALRMGDRMGGHFVTGHIDGLGKILRWEQSGKDYILEITALPELLRYVIFKGSVAIDGISLTVAAVKPQSFEIWIIPHTRTITALRERSVGDAVNLEVDMLGKYVEQFVATWDRSPKNS